MSFLIFKRSTLIPPSGFCFKDPDTGYVFEGHLTYASLLKAVKDYRIKNGLEPILDLHYALQDYMCNLPINKRADVCREIQALQDITLKQFISGGKFYLTNKIKKWFKIDEDNVDYKTIVKRRSICSKCPFNVPLDNSYEGVNIRSEIKKIMDKEFRHIETDFDQDLGVCGACNCSVEYKTCLTPITVAKAVKKMDKVSRDKFPRSRADVATDFNSDGKLFNCHQYSDFRKYFKEDN